VVLLLILVFVIEFIEQYKWLGLSSTVHSCLFIVCAADVYFYFMFMSSSMKSGIVYATILINLLVYLLTDF